MNKDHDYYTGLLSAYIADGLEPAQVEELFAFIRQEPMVYRSLLDTPAVRQQLTDRAVDGTISVPDAISQRMLEKLLQATRPPMVSMRSRPVWYAAAALLILLASVYLLKLHTPTKINNPPAAAIADIQPGSNKATLTLAGGNTIVLDSTSVGQLAVQGNTTITRNANGQITYSVKDNATAVQNTLTTPRGGQYQLVLPDGTKVWVNAASSITYPTAFTGKERSVTIKGEAFFDIVQNKDQPFIVAVSDGPEIQVLGTRFNINAYTDEPSIRTTLVSGSVKVQYDHQSLLLQPNQQAAVGTTDMTGEQNQQGAVNAKDRTGEEKQQAATDAKDLTRVQQQQAATSARQLTLEPRPHIDEVLAWKNGSFLFDKAPLDVVMRQLSRWYDVDVVYTSGIPAIRFEGEMKRDLNLSEVLNILRKMEVHCKMDGRRLIVLP